MASININASKDTFYGTSFSPGPNGSATSLSFGGWGDWYYPFAEFDLSSIPVGSTITNAVFEWYGNGTPVNDPIIQVQRITSAWTEAGLTRTNLPSIDTTNRGTLVKPVGGSYSGGDITTLVQDWFTGASSNFGIKLNATINNQTNSSAQSREGANPPRLVVTYTPPTGNNSGLFQVI